MTEYVIVDITLTGKTKGKWALAEAQVARSSDFGVNDSIFHTITHLGNYLHPGDYALGYDVQNGIYNDDDISALKGKSLPDVILVKKLFANRKNKRRKRVSKKLRPFSFHLPFPFLYSFLLTIKDMEA